MPSEKSAGTTSISWSAHGSLEVPVPAAMSRMRSPGLASTALTTARRHSRSWPSESTSLVTSYFSATVSNIDATSTGFLSSWARVMRSSSHPTAALVAVRVARRPRGRGAVVRP